MAGQRTIRDRLLTILLPSILILSATMGALVYNGLYGAILDRFENKIVTTSGLVGALIEPGRHQQLVRAIGMPKFSGPAIERTLTYRSEFDPMRRVRRRLGLTYLYTQVPVGKGAVDYILDTTDGDEHTTAGYRDTLPADTMAGLRSVSTLGRIYLSPIQKQEAWGLLKTAAAPVWSPDGRIAASVGADVNIGIIRDSTENALLLVGLIGGVSMLIAATSISVVVGRLSRPLAAAKLAALHIAAGRTEMSLPRESLREIEDLNESLRETASRLGLAQREYSDAVARFEQTVDERTPQATEGSRAAA